MSYDALNRLRSRLDSQSKQTVYAYDADSRLVGVTDRLNRQRVYNYDDADRRTGETWKDAAGIVTQLLTYTYDAADQMLSASNAAGVYSFGYDLAGRVITVSEPYNLSLTFTYDAAGERTQVADNFGGVTTSVYDAAGRLTSRQLGGTVAAPARVDYGYSDRDELTGITRYSDLAGANKIGTTSYSYDDAGRLSNIQHNNASGGGLANYTYTYDAADRLATKIDNGVTTPYNYYDDNQLQQDGATTYSYDATGNRTNPGYTTGPDNRITSDGTWTYSYDDEGNTIKKTKGVNAETWTYGYDNANRLIWSEQRSSDGGPLLARVEYTYDVFGNRIRRVQYDGAMTVVSDQRFGYDGWDTAQPDAIGNENFSVYVDLDGANNVTARRIYGAGFDQPVARVDANGVAWYLTDRQGSVRQLLDNSGSVVASSDFDAFGNLTSGTLSDRLGYAGREWDSTLGVYYQRARLYAPTIGRFLQEDPIGADPANLFRYVGNAVTMYTDPSGYYWLENPSRSKNHSEDLQKRLTERGIPSRRVQFTWPLLGAPKAALYVAPEYRAKFQDAIRGIYGLDDATAERYTGYMFDGDAGGNNIVVSEGKIDFARDIGLTLDDDERAAAAFRMRQAAEFEQSREAAKRQPTAMTAGPPRNEHEAMQRHGAALGRELGTKLRQGDAAGALNVLLRPGGVWDTFAPLTGAGAVYAGRRAPTEAPVRQLKEMESQYRGEETGAVFGTRVKYLSNSERAGYRLTIKDGKIYDAQGNPYNGNAIFAMDKFGNFYAAKGAHVGEFHHSSFLRGQPVAGAGVITVESGVLKSIHAESGHYKPQQHHHDQVLSELQFKGIDLKGVDTSLRSPR